MQKIYLDQAATSFPKAPGTADAVFRFMTECGCNVGRGSYAGAYSAEEIVYDTRMFLCRLFGCGNDPAGPKRVVFTKNVTESLNILLKGFLRHLRCCCSLPLRAIKGLLVSLFSHQTL